MPEPEARYEWLTVHDDGSLSADLRDTSPAETDRRMVITQELLAGRVVLAADHRGAVEALRVADDLLRQFSISANDHSELIRREFGKAQRQINDALGER